MLGYVLLFTSNCACLTGVIEFFKKKLKHDASRPILIATMPFFSVVVVGCEIYRFFKNKKKWPQLDKHMDKKPSFTMKKIEQMIKKEHQRLCYLENLVIDLKDFGELHPGGRFVLTKNIGRDISKFFYGGYSMINNPQGFNNNTHLHVHSYQAFKMVQEMVIGTIEDQSHIKEPIQTRIVARSAASTYVFAFCFQTLDEAPVDNFKKWYTDLKSIGLSFLLCDINRPKFKRHYSICNTLAPEFYTGLKNAI